MEGVEEKPEQNTSWAPDGKVEDFFQDQTMVVPFLGAGFSAAGGLPNANDFKSALISHFGLDSEAEEQNLFAVANRIAGADIEKSLELRGYAASYFEDALENLKPDAPKLELLDNIVRVPSKLIVTLNYDGLLEQAARRHYREDQIEVVSTRETLARGSQRASEKPEDSLMIVHLHGNVTDPDTIVLDKWGYETMEGPTVSSFFRELMENRRICFLGTTFDEAGHIARLMQPGLSSQRHILFSTARTMESIAQRTTLDPYTHHVELETLPSRETLHPLVRYLVRTPSISSSSVDHEEASQQIHSLLDEHYIESRLTPWAENAQNSDWAHLISRMYKGRWSAEATSPQFEHERALANEGKVLVIGPPGSGKTQILAKAATLVSGPRQACLIRLGTVPVVPGDLSTTLVRWAASGGLKIDALALRQESFHFFLDGIDEVAPEQQEKIARQISDLMTEFPQHNFAVSSRPIPAATILSDLGWSSRQVELGTNWQHRYLEGRGLTLYELMNGQEVHGELVSLLQLPFFLDQAVELHKSGYTREMTAWGLIEQLVDNALAKESSLALLPLSVEDTRTWLQRSALTMRFSGVVALTQQEMEEIPLRDEERVDEGFIPSLIDRSMLRDLESKVESDPHVSFSHRIIGEFLAAEALLEVEPEPSVLDAIAPVVGVERSGVAPHWAVPISLVMSQSERWRDAIKGRDRMLWAASVPDDAPLSERQEAAETIWDTYCDWQVWIWRRERSGFVEDGEALSRLLASEGLADLVERIRSDLDDPSPQIQSNAIEVLSGARVDGLEADFFRMLEDEERKPVVKRRLAVAAEDLNLVGLLDELVRVATTTGDEAEAETCASAALKVVPDDRLMEVSEALAPDPLAGMMVMTRVLDRISPEGAVRILRVQVEANVDDLPYSNERDLFDEALIAGDRTNEQFAEDAIFVAAAWGLNSEEILALIESHKEIALRVIREATTLDSETGPWWHAGPLLKSFSADEVEVAGYHEGVVQGHRIAEQRAQDPDGGVPTVAPAPDPFGDEDEEPKEPKLSEILGWDRDKGDPVLKQYPSAFTRDVEDLSEDKKADLQNRLDEWLRDDSFLSAFRFVSRSSNGAEYKIDPWAHAWFWFGPSLNLPLSPERWAQMALLGVGYDPQHAWLREQATEESQEWLADVRDGGDARDWRNALLSSPKQLSPRVLSTIEADLLAYTGEVEHDIRYVLQRLVDEGAEQTVRRVASNELLTSTANLHLAELGDEEALEAKFAQLKESIIDGSVRQYDSIPWLKGARDEKYLARLFECLKLHISQQAPTKDGPVKRTGDIPRRRDRSMSGRMDETPNFLMEAIQAIGGEGAARGYEQLLEAERDKARYVRFRLDQIEESMFAAGAEEASQPAVERLGLPSFDPPRE